ncbi:MAG TPA: hypothetical protein VMN60_06095 [Longimicrobiales bacterium]|nr:hypothetical protein [Longimicrobiales bacterium]
MSPHALLITTFGGCLVGSFVPLVNTELVVLAAAAAAPPQLIVPIILIATATQMLAKAVLYQLGGGLLRLPHNRYTQRFHAAVARGATMRNTGSALLFTSAIVGFPPFYLTTIASGALRLPLARFLIIGSVGRLLRFTALVLLPQLIKAAA